MSYALDASMVRQPRILALGLVLFVWTIGFWTITPARADNQTAPAVGQTYTVQPGDGLSAIAKRFNITYEALSQANGITDPNKLHVGQVLRIPTPGAPAQPPKPATPQATPQPTPPPAAPENGPAPETVAGPSAGLQTLSVGSPARNCLVHLPKGYTPTKRYPLLVFLHGAGGSAAAGLEQTGLTAAADMYGFIAAFPDGTGVEPTVLTWNAWNCCGFAQAKNIDDLSFLRSFFATLQERFQVQPGALYLSGFSNGASLAYRYALAYPESLAGVIAVSGALNCDQCNAAKRVRTLIIHGFADKIVLYKGGIREGGKIENKSVDYAAGFWARNNKCVPYEETVKDKVVKRVYQKCAPDADVIVYSINGADHAWPGGFKKTPPYPFTTTPTDDLKAADVIGRFVTKAPLP